MADPATQGQEQMKLPHARPAEKLLVVVMGVSGCGKSTLGAHIASALSIPFIDADDLHPKSNVEKMSRGEPLTDEDRAPWLERVREAAAAAAHHTAQDHIPGPEAVEEAKHETNSSGGTGETHPEHPPEHASDCPPPAPLPKHPADLLPAPAEHELTHPGESEKGGAAVVACSALKVKYRDVLRGGPLRTVFVHPHGEYDVLLARMHHRKSHFMKANMLDSQLATLEDPIDEPDCVRVPVEVGMIEQVEIALDGLQKMGVVTRE
ncbi:unnamed protein product [Peniophora sp. CBMAI 1063]|nr:unnamed protein product [Peniophora sp. CBMAI 1063]